MVAFRTPRKSGAHRIGAIALFRALLTQCRALPVAEHKRVELQNIVRNRFKQTQHIQAFRRLRVAFDAGYEAIDHLDHAVAGKTESKDYILSLLAQAPSQAKQSPGPSAVLRKIQKRSNKIPTGDGNTVKTKSIFDRPRPLHELSGRRHVPRLFSANGIPVLRIKKPQPYALSAYLTHRIKTRQAWHDRRFRLASEGSMAAMEDRWDEDMSRLASEAASTIHTPPKTLVEPTWRSAVDEASVEVGMLIAKEKEKNRQNAEAMQAVVDREQALYDQEKAARKRPKNGSFERAW